MNKEQKNKYIKFVKFLGIVLGKNYEIILHDINKNGSYVAAIENNHISKRSLNSPLTGMALELIKSKAYLDKDYLVNYKAITIDGKKVQGSTFFIKENNEIQGMLCINYDNNEYLDLAQTLLSLGNISESLDLPLSLQKVKNFNNKDNFLKEESSSEEIIEYLHESIEDIINMIDPIALRTDIVLKPEKKEEIVEALYTKGVFNIKGAIGKVATLLNISEPSIYRYLKKVKK